jgi:hypothetical protein
VPCTGSVPYAVALPRLIPALSGHGSAATPTYALEY